MAKNKAPKEGEPETPAEGEEFAPEPIDDAQAETDRLKAENESLRAQNAALSAPAIPRSTPQAVVTSEQLENLSVEQWEPIEKQMNLPKEEILARMRRQEAKSSNDAILARTNVIDAIECEVEADPQTAKLKGGIKAYFEDVPLSERANPERVKAHMKKAKIFARGLAAEKGGGMPQERGPKFKSDRPGREGDEDGSGAEASVDENGRVRVGQSVDLGDNFKLNIEQRVEPEKMKQCMKGGREPNAVKMPNEKDSAPRFR